MTKWGDVEARPTVTQVALLEAGAAWLEASILVLDAACDLDTGALPPDLTMPAADSLAFVQKELRTEAALREITGTVRTA